MAIMTLCLLEVHLAFLAYVCLCVHYNYPHKQIIKINNKKHEVALVSVTAL